MSRGSSPPRRYSDEALELIASRFKLLSEPMRLRILRALRDGEKGVTELVEELDAGQANVSKHLGVLRRQRVVGRRKDGLHAYYRIVDPTIFELCERACESIESGLEARRAALAR